jgi:CheY-like chemotaxis protein
LRFGESNYNNSLALTNPSENNMTMQLFRKLSIRSFLALCCMTLACFVNAQDDPFGMSGDEPASDNPADTTFEPDAGAEPVARRNAKADEVELDTDPIIGMLRTAPPNTPSQVADALTWTIRLKRWDEVGRLLDTVKANRWSMQQKAEIAKQMGSAIAIRMRGVDAELNDSQKATALEIYQAPSKLAQQPEWIDQAINQLASPTRSDRFVAQKRLHDSSSPALARLINRMLAGDKSVPPANMAGAILSFGDEGKDAMQAACLVRDLTAAARVHLAIADVNNTDFGAEQGAALYSRILPAQAQQDLTNKLIVKYNAIPKGNEVEAYLAKRFSIALAEYQNDRSKASTLTSYLWRPAPDGQSIERVEVAEADRLLEVAARLAAHRLRMQHATNQGLVESAAVLMQRLYKVRPQLIAGQLDSDLLADVPPELVKDSVWWQQVYAQCNEWQLHGGSIRVVQSMSESMVSGQLDSSLAFVSQLLKDPRPIVRFSALELLDRLDPKSSYAGAERALETAVEMTRLQGGPQVLVIGLQSEMRQAAKQQLGVLTGADATIVNSGVAALKVLDEAIPTELIMIVDRVADMGVGQLLQRIRKSHRGRSLPIALLTDELRPQDYEEVRNTGGIVTSVLTRDPKQMERVLKMLEAQLDAAPMTTADRASFAESGNRFLGRIAADRKLYAFYPLGRWQSALMDSDQLHASQVSLLSGIGTSDSQRKLAWLTAELELTEAQRMEAARAFARSIKQFGIALKREDVVQAYDLYNEVGPKDPVAEKTLGKVLDMIEAHAGKAPWPDGF